VQLAIENVSKRYGGGNWALRDFSLQLAAGVLGLLGPNGAGKTTLLSILATITCATAGRVVWNGTDLANDADALRSTLGYLPQDFGVYPSLNAVEFLEYLAAVKGLDAASGKRRIAELLNLVNLTDVRKRPLGAYSGGMKQRIGIAQALLNDPQLLIVDEPTAGLDPEERVRRYSFLVTLAGTLWLAYGVASEKIWIAVGDGYRGSTRRNENTRARHAGEYAAHNSECGVFDDGPERCSLRRLR